MSSERTRVQDEALQWAARMDRSDWGATGEAELADWLAAEPGANGALLRAQAAWISLDLHESSAQAPDAPRRPWHSRRKLMASGFAAMAASIAGLMVYSSTAGRYDTQVGEIRRVALADGSTAAINTDSEIVVDMGDRMRNVRLERGEAWFQVKHDLARPFVVNVGKVSVRAVGTAFSVRKREQGVEIIVTEGVVSTWTEDTANVPVSARAGTKLIVSETSGAGPAIMSRAGSAGALAWRSGQLELTARPLHEAAAEFNRYNARKIVIKNPAIADEQVDGIFRTDDPEGFATAVHHILDVPVKLNEQDEITIGR